MNGHDCVPIKLYLQKQAAGWIWLRGHSLPTPELHNWASGIWLTPLPQGSLPVTPASLDTLTTVWMQWLTSISIPFRRNCRGKPPHLHVSRRTQTTSPHSVRDRQERRYKCQPGNKGAKVPLTYTRKGSLLLRNHTLNCTVNILLFLKKKSFYLDPVSYPEVSTCNGHQHIEIWSERWERMGRKKRGERTLSKHS